MPPLNKLQLGCIALAVSQTIAIPLQAATIVVNSSADPAIANNNQSSCSLRSAITSANTDTALSGCASGNGDDTIEFELPNNTTITLNSELPTVTSNISINGTDQDNLTVSGNNNSRIVSTANSANLEISSVTLTNGSVNGNGGAINVGPSTSLTVNNSTFSNSTAVISSAYPSGLSGLGGAINSSNPSTVTINNSTFTNNNAYAGAGLYSSSSIVSVANSTFTDNSANFGAGILFNGGVGFAFSNTATVTNSTFSNNSVSLGPNALGGGAAIADYFSNTTITNSTISNNNAIGGSTGGGIYSILSVTTINNSIISGNTAPGEIAELDDFDTSFSVQNSLLGSAELNNASSFSFTPNSSNIIATNNGVGLNIPLNEIIEPLADNGGPTLTNALPNGSLAINAGDNTNCPETDQRGELRNDEGCDIGAFEVVPEIEEETFFTIPLSNNKTVIFGL